MGKRLLFMLVVVFFCGDIVAEKINCGISRFELYGELLAGKRVGIVANHTSLVGEEHAVDYLLSKGVELVCVFAPEHGFRGNADAGELIGDDVDAGSQLRIVSLYGKNKKPTPADLKGIEVMLFDIQDVGVRFYTYLSTLHYVMEACAENGIPLIVTDRPNPNAFYVDGPVLKEKFVSFVGMHPVPIVYGMTIGEYARMINGEGWLKNGVGCDLTVIPCEYWKRSDTFALPVPPSPNLPDSVSVMLYPSVCLFEGTVVNEGRGTLTPFQVFGHPELKNMPYSYTPRSIEGMSKSPKCMDQLCYGMDLRDLYVFAKRNKRINLSWLLLAYWNYAGESPFFTSFFDLLAGNDSLRKDILAEKDEAEIRASWENELQDFLKIRSKYLIYE